jgi:hypothetical protein
MAWDSRKNQRNLAQLRLWGLVRHLVVDFNLSWDAGVGRSSKRGCAGRTLRSGEGAKGMAGGGVFNNSRKDCMGCSDQGNPSMEGEPSRRTFLSEAYTEYPSPVDAGTGISGIRPRPATFVIPRHVRVEPSGEARANDPFQRYVRHRKSCRVQRMTAFTYTTHGRGLPRYLSACLS